jgi:hypothetical protein
MHPAVSPVIMPHYPQRKIVLPQLVSAPQRNLRINARRRNRKKILRVRHFTSILFSYERKILFIAGFVKVIFQK